MEILTLILIAIGLSFDSFAAAITSGVAKNEIRFWQATRIAFSLAFFQGMMPVLGWIIGMRIMHLISAIDHWIAFGLLAILGGKMILESLRKEKEDKTFDPLNLYILLGMSLATSIDAFIIGISFGFLNVNILFATLIIGSVTFIISMLGVLFGKKTGSRFGKKMEIAGGLILIGIGVKILIQHLYFP
jgi:putative Mn2+ efflux pump MntP